MELDKMTLKQQLGIWEFDYYY